MTLEDARRECSLRNGRLATREELLEARAGGLNVCSYAWMDDGSVEYVIRTPTPGCTFSTGIVYTSRVLADGWCIDDL